jgi:hypothetical protein
VAHRLRPRRQLSGVRFSTDGDTAGTSSRSMESSPSSASGGCSPHLLRPHGGAVVGDFRSWAAAPLMVHVAGRRPHGLLGRCLPPPAPALSALAARPALHPIHRGAPTVHVGVGGRDGRLAEAPPHRRDRPDDRPSRCVASIGKQANTKRRDDRRGMMSSTENGAWFGFLLQSWDRSLSCHPEPLPCPPVSEFRPPSLVQRVPAGPESPHIQTSQPPHRMRSRPTAIAFPHQQRDHMTDAPGIRP